MKFTYVLASTMFMSSAFSAIVPVKPAPIAPAVDEALQGVKNVADTVCNALGCMTTTLRTTTRPTATPATTPIVRLGARAVVPPKPVVVAPKPVVAPPQPKAPAKVEMVNAVKTIADVVCNLGNCMTTTRKVTTKVPKSTAKSSSKTPVRLGARATPAPAAAEPTEAV